jgi:hypothetical protein
MKNIILLNKMVNYEKVSQVILNVTIISTLMGVFLFTYASMIENKIVVDESEYIASSILSKVDFLLTNDTEKTIVDTSVQDEEVEKNNDELRKKYMIVLGVIFTTGIISTLVVAYFGDVSTIIVKEVVSMLLFTALMEFIFLNVITKQYKLYKW